MAEPKSDRLGDTITREDASWLLAVTFAGLGTGFVLLILTLSMMNAIALCAVGVIVVWPLARNKNKGNEFALQSVGIYFGSAVVGVVVGWSSTFGTGLPVVNILISKAGNLSAAICDWL